MLFPSIPPTALVFLYFAFSRAYPTPCCSANLLKSLSPFIVSALVSSSPSVYFPCSSICWCVVLGPFPEVSSACFWSPDDAGSKNTMTLRWNICDFCSHSRRSTNAAAIHNRCSRLSSLLCLSPAEFLSHWCRTPDCWVDDEAGWSRRAYGREFSTWAWISCTFSGGACSNGKTSRVISCI